LLSFHAHRPQLPWQCSVVGPCELHQQPAGRGQPITEYDRGSQIDSLQKGVYFQDHQVRRGHHLARRLVYKADNGLAPYLSYSESFFPVAGVSKAGQVFVPTEGKQYEFGDLPLVGQQRLTQRFGASGTWRWGR
jgi:hypothetical protein